MSKIVDGYNIKERESALLEDSRSPYGIRSYISLFSSAGVGCYGFKMEGYYCIATAELLERRLKIQKYNDKCFFDSGYVCGDMTQQETKDKIYSQLDFWKRNYHVDDLDVVIATPPCQGMSVANHKKKDELKRNSLVVESIGMIKTIHPKFFIFENVRAFLKSICTDLDGNDKSIKEAIDVNLGGLYSIAYNVLNFKDYGCPSSRTRTLVIGVRKDILDITPYDLYPEVQPERTLRDIIGNLPSLKVMGEVCPNDIYHNFRPYAPHMESWIADISEGQSAFDNPDPAKRPHTVKDGVIVPNAQKNGDKYTRQCWDKVAPCIHTRNDIMASQNTVHPSDNRVFSVREVMRMMSVPDSFKWTERTLEELNALTPKEKAAFLKKEEMNIRQNLGEAVPTIIFKQVAHNMARALSRRDYTRQEIDEIIRRNKLEETNNLVKFIKSKKALGFVALSKIAELANEQREYTAAFYTKPNTCFSVISNLPDLSGAQSIRILEPAVGTGNFLPVLFEKYADVPSVTLDVVDINAGSIEVLKALMETLSVPKNFKINYINDDFLLHSFECRYDVIVGNPPFKKLGKGSEPLSKYKEQACNKQTDNLFSFFIEKALTLGDTVALISPKSLVNAPEFDLTRKVINGFSIAAILDFGEKAFKGVKIETICTIINTKKKSGQTRIESLITNSVRIVPQQYITDATYPYWLLYRDESFDNVARLMIFNIFKAYRDRSITKKDTKSEGRVRVLKSRNIGNNKIIDIPGYDCYMDAVDGFAVSRFLNAANCYLLPNLTYNPRACKLPAGCIADGSVAILTLADNQTTITDSDLEFYATPEFTHFYSVARNLGTRSLNIDNNSVFFFGKLKEQ